MSVYDPNACSIPKPTKLSAPIMVGGTEVWEEPYNRVQIFGSMLKYMGKWRMFYMSQYGIAADGNKLHNIGYAEADSPSGPWRKPVVGSRNGLCSSVVLKDEDAFSCYFDTYAEKFRGLGTVNRAESTNGVDWLCSTVDYRGGPISLIRHQPFSPNNGFPFVATVRGEAIVNGEAKRRVAFVESGDWSTWSAKQYLSAFDSPDNYATQPYGLAMTSYGGKIIALVPWLHLDQGSNQIGQVDAELVCTTPPANATSLSQCTWTRTYQPFLSCGASGSFDYGMVLPSSMVIEDGTVYIPYTAQKEKHGIVPAPGSMTIGLATMTQTQLDAALGGV